MGQDQVLTESNGVEAFIKGMLASLCPDDQFYCNDRDGNHQHVRSAMLLQQGFKDKYPYNTADFSKRAQLRVSHCV
jgi:hypothetical protein